MPQRKQPAELKLHKPSPQDNEPVELSPLPTEEVIELTIRSTTRPMIGKPTVRNRVGKPKIGATELVRTPAFGTARLETNDTPSE